MKTLIGCSTTLCIVAALFGCQQSGQANLEANKQIVKRFGELVNATEFDALDEIVAANFVRHSQASGPLQANSLEEFKALQQEYLKSFPDQHVTMDMMVAEGDYVAVYATYTGTQDGPMPPFPPTGKKTKMPFLAMFRLQESKIVEMWVEWDNLAVLNQLGHFPPPETSQK